jgi:hypothetical protein
MTRGSWSPGFSSEPTGRTCRTDRHGKPKHVQEDHNSNDVVGIVATQGLVELGDLCFERFVSNTLQQLMKVRQTAPQARLVGFPSHLEMALVVVRKVVGQAQKRERRRPFP